MVAIGGSVPFVSPRAPIHHRASNHHSLVYLYTSTLYIYIYMCIYIYIHIYGACGTECIWSYGWLLSPGAPSASHPQSHALGDERVQERARANLYVYVYVHTLYTYTYIPYPTPLRCARCTVKAYVCRVDARERTNTDEPGGRSTGGPNRRPLISLRGNPQPVTVFTHM